jgi:hypothetical protein
MYKIFKIKNNKQLFFKGYSWVGTIRWIYDKDNAYGYVTLKSAQVMAEKLGGEYGIIK